MSLLIHFIFYCRYNRIRVDLKSSNYNTHIFLHHKTFNSAMRDLITNYKNQITKYEIKNHKNINKTGSMCANSS